MRRALFYGRDDHGGFSRPIDYEGAAYLHAVHVLGEWLTRAGLRLTMWAEDRLCRVTAPTQPGGSEEA
jgi:hypothetical protein